jgi:uncharacterized protein YoxC
MPVIVQVCVVIVTIAIVTLAINAFRLMNSMNATLARVDELVESFRGTPERIRHVLDTVEEVAGSARTMVAGVKDVVGYATDISASVIDEVAKPVLGAVAVLRGLRTGTKFLMERLTNGPTKTRRYNQGGNHV